MRRSLKYASLIVLILSACSGHPYRHIVTTQLTGSSALIYKPTYQRELYRCVVDGRFLFKKFHLSGVLLFKNFEDKSTRVVFQNEMGIAFFDFKWDARDSFSVASIMSQLDKPAVVKTLQTDIALFLMKGLSASKEQQLIAGEDTVSQFPMNAGHAYYKRHSGRTARIDYAGKTAITTITLTGNMGNSMPEGAIFKHHKANFTIDLKRLQQNDN